MALVLRLKLAFRERCLPEFQEEALSKKPPVRVLGLFNRKCPFVCLPFSLSQPPHFPPVPALFAPADSELVDQEGQA